ncbi:SDR family oxidoreductase [Rugosimonospora africana]|uniref:Oxidoreductase n=1 Tax=Rugosimonospora africana TaxID=556532 RepID=A0A8J3VUP5_9ACTN|nr:SDR family oxidoreductase [Rugosimonospora africana]GIH19495.1 oxidoreductase [Rugosimonospora africana]
MPADVRDDVLRALAAIGVGGHADPELERAVGEAYRRLKRRAKARRDAASRAQDRSTLAGATRYRDELPDPSPPAPGPSTGPPSVPLPGPPPVPLPGPPSAPLPDPSSPLGSAPGSDPGSGPDAGGEAGPGRPLNRVRRCYVCKQPYRRVDADYHQLCPECADTNRLRREARCDLRGRRAIVTGGRIKIGFHTALKLLRDGADVLVTTRFPRDAARRYAALADAADWSHRLHVHGVDLLRLDEVTQLVATVGDRWTHLDILVNNAAQTVHRPPAYYREVREAEREPLRGAAARIALTSSGPAGRAGTARPPLGLDALLPAGTVAPSPFPAGVTDPFPFPVGAADAAPWPTVRVDDAVLFSAGRLDELALFPAGRLDETGQPLDLRRVNSWTLRDGDVTPYEWLEVHVVNAFAPFLLTSRLRPLLAASPHPDRYVVQVTAMEGRYTHATKTPRHPHTNMAKASLNMLTRTVAGDYARDGIFMNSVDTGWVTDERPHPHKAAQRENGFRPPLDVIDGAARVYDPIVRGIGGAPVHGQFLKDYRSVEW